MRTGEPADRVRDDSRGLGNNLGHGTGTAGILAGRWPDGRVLGGAPEAEVVPLRVANSVVLFYTSAIAQALDYVHGLATAGSTPVHVVTMSMGGLASRAWAEAVNALYEAGVFVVTAAGNNCFNFPTRNLVYPARFNRVVAACGVMCDQNPYADLKPPRRMAGNYGPERLMRTALAAYTPNVPWPRLGAPDIVDLDGRGTSSATPQIAAAAALWLTRHWQAAQAYREPWMRVEAIRQALFGCARLKGKSGCDTAPVHPRIGHGALRADEALQHKPATVRSLKKEAPDDVSFPLLRVLLGMGLTAVEPDRATRMFELEALQLSQSREGFEGLLDDPQTPPESLSQRQRQQVGDWLLAQEDISPQFREALLRGRGRSFPPPPPPAPDKVKSAAMPAPQADSGSPLPPVDPRQWQKDATPPPPTHRRLKVYAMDPSLGTQLETLPLNVATVQVPWEADLAPGPVGEYLEVVDVDPPSGLAYAPVDLAHPHVLAEDGVAPSESNPQFHQQMVYAVAMKTIGHFERALGRSALWATHRPGKGERFVRRLRIYPHALRERNAYYSPAHKALLFGYFDAPDPCPGDILPGGRVFTCLSHDIIAHETTHALLDGLHRRFREPTNRDVLAFHEAFADIVALFQHFTMPEALLAQVAGTRGDLRKKSLLGELAVQFGKAIGHQGALRSAIGSVDDNGNWAVHQPTGREYAEAEGPHALGAVLVAAVFDAFLQIYEQRTQDLVRLASGGTGILPEGAIHPDLARRLAQEAAKVAGQVLNICIRALDYCPTVDITFGEYLRALVTADRDLVPEDSRSYRVAFISAFRRRGIYPEGVVSLSEQSLLWNGPELHLPPRNMLKLLESMSLGWTLGCDRLDAFISARENAKVLHKWLCDTTLVPEPFIRSLGLDRSRKKSVVNIGGQSGWLGGLEVHSVRPSRRIGPDGQTRQDLVVEITQRWEPHDGSGAIHRGGCTMLVGREEQRIRYVVCKRLDNLARFHRQRAFRQEMARTDLASTYFDPGWGAAEPFALLNRFW